MNPCVKLWTPLRFFCSQGSCGLDSRRRSSLFCRAPRAVDPIDASLIVCTSSLFSSLSSPGGEIVFFIWIVTIRNGFGGVLVSRWFILAPYSFWAQNHSQHSPVKLRTTGIQLNILAPKCSHGLLLPGDCMCHLQSLQNDISSKRLPQSATCHVYLHMNNPSLLKSVQYVTDDSSNCWTIQVIQYTEQEILFIYPVSVADSGCQRVRDKKNRAGQHLHMWWGSYICGEIKTLKLFYYVTQM